MELTSTKFQEIGLEEISDINGGAVLLGTCLTLLATAIVVPATATIIKKDLQNVYNNGYNEVYNANK